jgi:hypothetical protein
MSRRGLESSSGFLPEGEKYFRFAVFPKSGNFLLTVQRADAA